MNLQELTMEESGEASRQFISVIIGKEEYGVAITAIREIRGWTPTTALPNTPIHMRGVINLRGAIIPVVDLRARFTGQLTDASSRHVIMVVSVGDRDVGLLVDAVADILTVAAGTIQSVPELEHSPAANDDVLNGIIAVEGRMVALLDLTRLIDHNDSAIAADE